MLEAVRSTVEVIESELSVPCRGRRHRIAIRRDGELDPLDHVQAAERTLAALGGDTPHCLGWIAAVRDSTWQMTALEEMLADGWTPDDIRGGLASGIPQLDRPEAVVRDAHLVPAVLARLSRVLLCEDDEAVSTALRRCAHPFVQRTLGGRVRITTGPPSVESDGRRTTVRLPHEWLTSVWLYSAHPDEHELLAYEASPATEDTFLVRAFDSSGQTHVLEVPTSDAVRLLP